MKYKMLLLLALACAIIVAAMGGTLAGYTDREAFSFSIQADTQQVTPTPTLQATQSPEATQTPQATQSPKPTKKPKKNEAEETSSEPAAGETPTASPENNG